MKLFLLLAIVSFLTQFSAGARILFLFAGGNLSHKTSVWPFVYGLAERGHEVTFVSSHHKIPRAHSKIKDVASDALAESTKSAYDVNRFKSRELGLESELWATYEQISLQTCRILTNTSLNGPELNDIFENGGKYYDLVVLNAVYGECGLLIANHFGCKYIVFDTTTVHSWFHTTYGLPWQSSWVPDMPTKFTSYPFSFMDRLMNFWSYYLTSTRPQSFRDGFEQIMKERFKKELSFFEMERNASLVFVNTHPAIDFARSLPPMFIHVGGMQCWEPIGQLPKELQDFMDNAEDGVILITFGSTIELNKLSDEHLNTFFNMMRKFSKVRFIWRWVGPAPENSPQNLLGASWLPQKDILNHPKLRAFMTHCGYGSVTEAACFGVPMIAVPLFADQDFNAVRIQAQEIGVRLEVKGLSQESMDSAVEEILSDSKYKKNMMSRSKILKDRPMSPVDTAIYWSEFVLRHDDFSSFKPMELEQSMWVRNMFDVYLALGLTLLCLPILLMYVIFKFAKMLGL